jgi:hypothetical protein
VKLHRRLYEHSKVLQATRDADEGVHAAKLF